MYCLLSMGSWYWHQQYAAPRFGAGPSGRPPPTPAPRDLGGAGGPARRWAMAAGPAGHMPGLVATLGTPSFGYGIRHRGSACSRKPSSGGRSSARIRWLTVARRGVPRACTVCASAAGVEAPGNPPNAAPVWLRHESRPRAFPAMYGLGRWHRAGVDPCAWRRCCVRITTGHVPAAAIALGCSTEQFEHLVIAVSATQHARRPRTAACARSTSSHERQSGHPWHVTCTKHGHLDNLAERCTFTGTAPVGHRRCVN